MKEMATILICLIGFVSGTYSQSQIRSDQLYNLNEMDSIDQIIRTEATNLDTLILFTQVWLSDQVATQFDPTFGVVINKNYILQRAKQKKITDLRNLFRLILSHEKMHALQHMRLAGIGRTFQNLNSEERQILECQADMCAGFLFLFPSIKEYSEVISKSLLYTFRNAPQNSGLNKFAVPEFSNLDSLLVFSALQRNFDGLQLFFSLGESEGVFGNHPNPYSRKTAFEMGVNAFHFTAMQYPLAKSIANKITPAEWAFLNSTYKIVMATLGVLPHDFLPQGYFELWSQRVSQKIVHLSNKASTRILFTIKQSKWDTSINHPLHYFEIEARNGNPDSMRIDMSVMTKIVARKNSEDPLKSKISAANHYLVVIPPNGSYSIKDSIVWIPGNDSTMPSVSYPGDEGSLYNVFPTNVKVISAYATTAAAINTSQALAPQVTETDMLLRRLPSIQREFSLASVDQFKTGAGLLWKDSRHVKYNAYIGREGFSLYIPLEPGDVPFLSKTVGTFDQFNDALLAYTSLQKGVIESGPGLSLVEAPDQGKDNRYSEMVKSTNKAVYSLSISKDYLSYKLTIEVFRD